ncbi:unnamed protein product [Musa acuminata subsp. burmannicoides]
MRFRVPDPHGRIASLSTMRRTANRSKRVLGRKHQPQARINRVVQPSAVANGLRCQQPEHGGNESENGKSSSSSSTIMRRHAPHSFAFACIGLERQPAGDSKYTEGYIRW